MGKEKELREIEEEIYGCKKCELWKIRKFPVPGEGNPDAEIMLIGLGPGYNENEQGKPFVGQAGKFLDELLKLKNLSREEIYITNVIKCYLPDNKPTQNQIKACSPYLDSQIDIIKPKIILTLGNVATSHIFQKFGLNLEPMGRIHGRIFMVNTLFLKSKIVPMYHPASALYNPGMKEILKKDWSDLDLI